MHQPISVQGIDHVELFVPDRYAAAKWYEEVLGLRLMPAFEEWASDPYGHRLEVTTYNYEYVAQRLAEK